MGFPPYLLTKGKWWLFCLKIMREKNCILNSVYGTHWIFGRVRIVAPIPKRTETTEKGKQIVCHVSPVTYRMLHVTCHLSFVTNATTTATDAAYDNSPTLHRRLVWKDQKLLKHQPSFKKMLKPPQNRYRYANISNKLKTFGRNRWLRAIGQTYRH